MMNKGNLCKFPAGLFFLALGISSLIYTPMDFFFDIRLRMIPGTPPYEFWANPPENILMNVYIFNITNSEAFLNGTDKELHVQEVGPIVFREKLTHSNIIFNENSTLTYTTTRIPVYLPERNTISLNDTIMAPNLAVLTMASFFQDSSFLVKASINMLINRYKSQPIVKTTIYNYLLNSSDPALSAAKMFGGSTLVPSTNVGLIPQMYLRNVHNVTVYIGPKYDHNEFFNIVNYDGYEWIPGFKRCLPRFVNTSEVTLFPQFLKQEQVIWGWKSVLCKVVEGRFTNETSRYGMTANRYDVPLTLFHRTEPSYLDCHKGNPTLPNGVADISVCYNGYPFVASFPHFMNADPEVTKRVKGLNPRIEDHGSFLIMEKLSGVPMNARAIFQISLNTQNLRGFNDKIRKFSDMYVPMAYVGYEVEGLPWHVYTLMYFLSVIIPNTQLLLSLVLLTSGCLMFYFLYNDIRRKVDKSILSTIETEKFLK